MTCFCWSFWINNFLSNKKDSETRFWFSRRKNFHVSLLLIKILFYLLTHSLWFKFTYLTAFVNLLLSFNFLFIGAALLLISTWLYSNPRSTVQFSEKGRTSLKYPEFKTEIVKHSNHCQTVANQPKLFDFDTPKYKKYFDNLWQIWP